jgi:hypothetical protein
MSSSCKPLLCIISAGSRQAFRQIKFSDKKLKKVGCVTYPVFEGIKGGRCTKFEVNKKNLK